MSSWPGCLPDYVLQDGYDESLPNYSIHTEMDVGPPKSRQRDSNMPAPMHMRVYMTRAQTEILDEFYETVLAGGSLTFTKDHPRLETTATMKFTGPPRYTSASGLSYYADMDVIVLPS